MPIQRRKPKRDQPLRAIIFFLHEKRWESTLFTSTRLLLSLFFPFLLPKFQLLWSLPQAFTNHGPFFSESWADLTGTHSHSLKILASGLLFFCQPLLGSSFLVTSGSMWIIQLSTQGPHPSGPWPPQIYSFVSSHLISQHVCMNTL